MGVRDVLDSKSEQIQIRFQLRRQALQSQQTTSFSLFRQLCLYPAIRRTTIRWCFSVARSAMSGPKGATLLASRPYRSLERLGQAASSLAEASIKMIRV